jgi:hypothetical protein
MFEESTRVNAVPACIAVNNVLDVVFDLPTALAYVVPASFKYAIATTE